MKILVTGSSGYIGSVLTQILTRSGHQVTGLDTEYYHSEWFYLDQGYQVPTTIVKDTRNVTVEDLKGFDAVVHLAELSNDPLALFDKENTYRINRDGSTRLAKTVKEAGVSRFVYASSCSAYGIATTDFVTEKSPTFPQSAYAECKIAVENAVSKLADAHFSPTFMRNATVFGVSPNMRFDLVLNNLMGLAYTTKQITMMSDGTPWRPLVHIKDVSRAVLAVLEAPKEDVHNQIFNVGSTAGNYQVRDLARIVGEVVPGCEVTVGTQGSDTRSYRADFEKIKKTLDFECNYDAKDGAQELLHVFKTVGLTKEVFENKSYSRLKQLEYLTTSGKLDHLLFWRTYEN